MDGFGVVEQRDVDIGVELLDLVEVEGGEEAMPPAECGVGIDQDVLVLLGLAEDFLENGTAEGIEAGDRDVQDAAGGDVGRLVVHHLSDVEDRQIMAGFPGHLLNGFEIGGFVDADLTGDDGAHADFLWRKSAARL